MEVHTWKYWRRPVTGYLSMCRLYIMVQSKNCRKNRLILALIIWTVRLIWTISPYTDTFHWLLLNSYKNTAYLLSELSRLNCISVKYQRGLVPWCTTIQHAVEIEQSENPSRSSSHSIKWLRTGSRKENLTTEKKRKKNPYVYLQAVRQICRLRYFS